MLTAWLERAAARDPSKVAVVYGDQRLRYDELLESVGRCAAGLRKCGVGDGDCVAVVLHNCPEFIVTFFATAMLNAVFLPLNPAYTAQELRKLLDDARPRLIVSGDAGMRVLPALAAERDAAIRLIAVGSPAPGSLSWPALMSAAAQASVRSTNSGRALYLYTSGSTDSYKRVCCTQENLYWEARNFVETAGLGAADTILCAIPLFHSYGIGNCLLDAAFLGATLVLLPPDQDGADPPFVSRCHLIAELFRTEKIAFYPGVPHQFAVLASLPQEFPIDLSGARLFVSSGDALPASTYARFLARFGKPIRSLYGSTEAGSIAINMDPDPEVTYGSVGMPLSNVSIEIRDVQGKALAAGVDGEIWVKSPTIPPTGYDNRGGLSGVFLQGGFYGTGDVGHKNERGQLLLAGRKQSFINVSGFKVDTSEVEAVLESCPGVREVAVLGVELPRMGMLVKAAIVTEGPCRKAQIREFCRQRLAFYKVPRLIESYTALPRSAIGKVLKSQLGGVGDYLREIRGADAAGIVALLPTVPPGRRRSMIASLVHTQVAAVLTQPIAAVPRDVGFTELGMDSFASLELLTRLEYLFDCELPQTFTFDHPTISATAEGLMDLLGFVSVSATAAPGERNPP